jgi:protein TonB
MLRASPPSPTGGYAPSRGDRFASITLALATSLALMALLISMGRFVVPGKDSGTRLVAINLSGDKAEKDHPQAQKAHQVKAATAPHAMSPPKLLPHVDIPAAQHYELPPGFIRMSHDEFASADIGKMKRADTGGAGAGSADGASDGEGQGEGPGGARLYNAQWYREPTDAELAGYLQQGRAPGEWAMIVCRTVEKYHVDDCRELDESPRGSGTARALRQAAWQFLVRPPRVDGKPQVGAWVRIRFDFTKGRRESGAG